MWTVFKVFRLCYHIVLCFGFLATKYVGSYLPDQGLILYPLLWKVKS